jgi:hypothetical protein
MFNFEKLDVWQKAIDFSQAFIGYRQGVLGDEAFRAIYDAAEEQSWMLSGLRKSLLQK